MNAKSPIFLTQILEDTEAPIWVNFRINDWKDGDRERPRVTIEYADNTEVSIDIIESIRTDAISVGHPFILAAINRWQQIIRYNHHRARDRRGGSRSETLRAHIERREIAKGHLERLGKALVEGATARAVAKEVVFDYHARVDMIVLSVAWRLLKKPAVRELRNDNLKRKLIENTLSSYEPGARVMTEFFRSNKGRGFLHDPGAWGEIRNAFDAWYHGLESTTVKSYRSRAKKRAEKTPDFYDVRFMIPEFRNEFNRAENWLPAITVCLSKR